MKYSRLTKEQFEALHHEFALFLAALGVDAALWTKIKAAKPQKMEEYLDAFSEKVWDDVLTKASYLEQWSDHQALFIACGEHQMKTIILKVTHPPCPIDDERGWQWVQQHLLTEAVSLYQGTKPYTQDRKITLFKFIASGAQLSDGKKYEALKRFF